MTLGTIKEINEMAEQSPDKYVVISTINEDFAFLYEWIVLVDPKTDQALWKGEFYVWEKEAHITGEDDEDSE